MIANKKILFVCGALALGKDGVGDYSRKIAALLMTHFQCEITLLAINDLYIKSDSDTYENGIRIIRIAHSKKWKYKVDFVKKYCENFSPNLISIQFVPFAFHSKGLPFQFPKLVSQLAKHYSIHIMFHELWVGLAKEDSYKFKLWGYLQKMIIAKMMRQTNALLTTTQSDLYKNILTSLFHKDVVRLPLLSNISIPKVNTEVNKDNNFNVIIFGAIQPGADYPSFLQELKNEHGSFLKVFFLGRNGSFLNNWVDECKNLAINNEIVGELEEERLSQYFLLGSIGVITTPYALFQKSGSAMALFKAKLHVVCVSRQWTPLGYSFPEKINGISDYKIGNYPQISKRFNEKYNFEEDEYKKLIVNFYKENTD